MHSPSQLAEFASTMATVGVVYVAYGQNAVREATESIRALKRFHCAWPIAVIGDRIPNTHHVDCPDEGRPGRWAKVSLLDLSPFDQTLFLDADTRVHDKLDIGFHILDDGWDLVIVPSKMQGQPLHNLIDEERTITLAELGDNRPLMLNTGVMWFHKSDRMRRLFAEWKAEWLRFKQHDQGALLRALAKCPVKLWLLGSEFNGGEIVEHLFGRASA